MNIGSFFKNGLGRDETDSAGQRFAPLPISSDQSRCHARCYASREEAQRRAREVLAGLPARRNPGRLTHTIGATARPSLNSLQRWNGVDECQRLLRVIAIGPSELNGQRNAPTIAY